MSGKYTLRAKIHNTRIDPMSGRIINVIECKPYYKIMRAGSPVRLRIEEVGAASNRYDDLIYQDFDVALYHLSILQEQFEDPSFYIAKFGDAIDFASEVSTYRRNKEGKYIQTK